MSYGTLRRQACRGCLEHLANDGRRRDWLQMKQPQESDGHAGTFITTMVQAIGLFVHAPTSGYGLGRVCGQVTHCRALSVSGASAVRDGDNTRIRLAFGAGECCCRPSLRCAYSAKARGSCVSGESAGQRVDAFEDAMLNNGRRSNSTTHA